MTEGAGVTSVVISVADRRPSEVWDLVPFARFWSGEIPDKLE